MNYYPHHIGDYAAATAHLTWDEDMAYTRLLRVYYQSEHGIPDKDRYRLARVQTKAHRQAVDVVLNEFFEMVDAVWHQKRADDELAVMQDKRRKAQRSADTRWNNMRTHSERTANASEQDDANAMRTHSDGNATNTNTNTKEKNQDQKLCPAGAGRFAEFYAVYPRHEDRRKAEIAWRRKGLDPIADEIIADVERRKREHRPWREGIFAHPTTYLNGERWKDDVDRSEPRGGFGLDRADAPGYMAGAL